MDAELHTILLRLQNIKQATAQTLKNLDHCLRLAGNELEALAQWAEKTRRPS